MMAGKQPRQLTKPYPEPGEPCCADYITNHAIGQYCAICARIKMPWGGFLPIARHQLLPVSVGMAGTILQAVHVDSPREISLLAMATWAIMTNQWKNALKMNSGIERVRIKAAAHALTDIALIAARKPEFAHLKWWDILQEALKNPTLTVAAYQTRICGPEPAPGTLRLKFKHDIQSSKPIVLPDQDEEQEQEQDDEDLGYDDSDNIPDGKKLLFLSRDEADEDDQDDAVDSKKERDMSPWQFVHGQDLDPAYWTTPDASKFFMVRQRRDDPSRVNVREYPHIAGFDWNDKEAVRALNRGRNQIILRTNGPKALPRLPWSQMERDLLHHQVILGLKHGYTKTNMPWEQIAHNINVDLEKVTQRAGSLLARPSKWNAQTNQEDFLMKRHLTMQKDRTGSERNPTGCMNQATKFGDLDALLRNSVEQPKKRKSLNEMIRIVSAHQGFNTVPRAPLIPSTTQAGKMQAEKRGGSSDDESIMKRKQSYHAANHSSANERPMKRKRSEHDE